jgi:hypothetical protein
MGAYLVTFPPFSSFTTVRENDQYSTRRPASRPPREPPRSRPPATPNLPRGRNSLPPPALYLPHLHRRPLLGPSCSLGRMPGLPRPGPGSGNAALPNLQRTRHLLHPPGRTRNQIHGSGRCLPGRTLSRGPDHCAFLPAGVSAGGRKGRPHPSHPSPND